MVPKYEKIKRDIVSKIESGFFKPGDKIYSEGDLKRIFEVSNTTVVKALNDLVSEGILVRRQGEGTFVRRNLLHRKVLFSERFPKSILAMNHQKNERVTTEVQIIDDEAIKAKLQTTDSVIKIEQKAGIAERLWKIQKRYIRQNVLSDEALTRIKNGGSLSVELGLQHNLITMPMEIDIQFKVGGVPELDTPAHIFIEKVIFTAEEVPVEYSESYIHPDFYEVNLIAE